MGGQLIHRVRGGIVDSGRGKVVKWRQLVQGGRGAGAWPVGIHNNYWWQINQGGR